MTGASGTPGDDSLRPLLGRPVVIWPDADPPGRAHGERLAAALWRLGHRALRILDWQGAPPCGDAADFFARGGTVEEVRALIARATPWAPGAPGPAGGAGEGDAAPVIVTLNTVTPRAVEWVRPQRWPRGKLVIVAGDPGLGKSWLLLDAAARFSTGADWPEGGAAPRGHVVLLTAEDALDDTVVPRLRAMGADLSRISAITAVRRGDREATFSLAVDLPHLEAAVARLRPVTVIIDPLTAYLSGADSHADADVRGLLGPLAKLAADHDVLVLALMHLNKATQMKALYRLSGSVAFSAAARAVFAVVKDEQDDRRRLFVPLKMNLGPTPPALAFTLTASGLVWEAEPVAHVDVEAALRGPSVATREPDAMESAIQFLRDYLEDGPQPAREIREAAEAHGHAWRTIQRAQQRLGITAVRMPRTDGRRGIAGWLWSLPASQSNGAQNMARKIDPGIPLLNGRVSDADLERHDLERHVPREAEGLVAIPGAAPRHPAGREVWRP